MFEDRRRAMTCAKLLACVCWAAVAVGCAKRALAPDDGGTGTIGPDGTAGGVDGFTRGPPMNVASWSAWPLANHDPANTRHSPNVGPQAPVERFAVDVGAWMMVIGSDGTLYTADSGTPYRIHALDPATGALLWSFMPTPSVPTTVAPWLPDIAAGPEGNLYVAYEQGGFYALARDGSVRWQFTTGRTTAAGDASVFVYPLVDRAGRVYVGEHSVIYAFESDGRSAWQLDTRAEQGAYPAALAADGTLYVAEQYGDLHAVDRGGAIGWTLSRSTSVPFISNPIVRGDGSLLLSQLGDKQFGVVGAGGSIVWQKPGVFGFVLGADDAPYAVDDRGVLRLSRDGTVVWQSLAGGRGALVDGAGTVYSATNGTIDAIDANGVLKWELRTADPAIPGSAAATPGLLAIGGDGTLYASYAGRIHALGGGGRCEGAPADCDDRDPCTVDRCDPAAGCVHEPKCVSPGSCTIASCAAGGACTFAAVADGTACDDGIACSQGDACRHGQCLAASSTCGLSGGWPVAGYDGRHTSTAALLGPETPAIAWTSTGPLAGVFVIAEDGTIFATAGDGVDAISPEGVDMPFAPVTAVGLAHLGDGGLYATEQSEAGTLHAFDSTGAARWTFETPAPLWAPSIAPSGALYAATRFNVFALAPDGSTRWNLPTGGIATVEPPAIGPDGTVYALCTDLWAIAPDGRVKWKRPVGWGRGLVVGPTGTVYVLVDGGVRAIDGNGADLWSWSLGTSALFAPALSPRGDLILTAGTTFYRLDAATGALRSSVTLPMPARTYQRLQPPVVDGEGVLFLAAVAEDTDSFQPLNQVTLFAVDPADRILWTLAFPRGLPATAGNLAIGPGRRLYLTLDGKLQAIGP